MHQCALVRGWQGVTFMNPRLDTLFRWLSFAVGKPVAYIKLLSENAQQAQKTFQINFPCSSVAVSHALSFSLYHFLSLSIRHMGNNAMNVEVI